MPDILSTSTSALLAFQRTISTISHNVANASTEGYSRQRTDLATRGGQSYGFGFIGSGVNTVNVQRIVDGFSFTRALDSKSELGRLTQVAAMAGRIDTTLSDSATSLAAPWSRFYDSAQAVSTQPASAAARTQFLSDAQAMVTRFHSLDAELKGLENETNQRMDSTVGLVNTLTRAVADINEEIAQQSGLTGGPPNDLLDKREVVIKQLAQLTGAVVQPQDDGALNVFTPSGQALVIGTTTATFTTINDPFRPERQDVALSTPSGTLLRLAGNAIGGELGGLMEFRETTLDPASIQLGRIAASLTVEFNAQHREGMDFNGQLGGDFFTPITPRIANANTNTGSASLSATISDTANYDGADFELRFDGLAWSARDSVSGATLAMSGTGVPADPFVVNGVSVVVGGGAAAAGDRFLVQPAQGAGGRIGLAISDPNKIAAALPVRASADLGNLGNGAVSKLEITDVADPALLTAVDIDFLDANTYTLNGGPPIAYAAGDTIAGNGWSLTLSGSPQAGDQFRISANAPGSSDNGNARIFALLDDAKFLDNGTNSLNSALQGLTTAVGTTARSAEQALTAQTAIDDRVTEERDAVSGVNLDEEAANMLRYQQAYQAASKMIGVADTLFQTILQAVAR